MRGSGRSLMLIALLVCMPPAFLHSQTLQLQAIADSVRLDTLRTHIQCLADDSSFSLGDSVYRITGRRDSTGRKLARLYLKAALDSYGLSCRLDTFGIATDYSIADVNILAEQPGTIEPSVKVIIGAHYDAIISGNPIAPGADDNASGVAAVLEAARTVSRYATRYTVVYALWDQEETGRNGSTRYAMQARSRSDSIRGVINIDMIGWDSVQTSGAELFVRSFGQSQALGDSLLALSRQLNTGITLSIIDPALLGSDHVSFWVRGYSAVCLTEQFYGGNRSPYYHTTGDRIEHINFRSLLGRSRLAAASIAWFAGIENPTGVLPSHAPPTSISLSQNYPNPFNPSTMIPYVIPTRSHVTLAVFNTLGQRVAVLWEGEQEAGRHEARFDANGLPSGVYFYRLSTGSFTATKKLGLMR